MAVLGCDVDELLQLSSCFSCLTESQLLAVEVRLREQIYADGAATTPRDIDELMRASRVWRNLTAHQRQAVKLRQLCNQAIILGARTSCDIDELRAESACMCTGASELLGILSYLECLQQQT